MTQKSIDIFLLYIQLKFLKLQSSMPKQSKKKKKKSILSCYSLALFCPKILTRKQFQDT